jgi:hypothetical protein
MNYYTTSLIVQMLLPYNPRNQVLEVETINTPTSSEIYHPYTEKNYNDHHLIQLVSSRKNILIK